MCDKLRRDNDGSSVIILLLIAAKFVSAAFTKIVDEPERSEKISFRSSSLLAIAYVSWCSVL